MIVRRFIILDDNFLEHTQIVFRRISLNSTLLLLFFIDQCLDVTQQPRNLHQFPSQNGVLFGSPSFCLFRLLLPHNSDSNHEFLDKD